MAFNRQFLKEHLYSGAISDVLDQMGYPNQTIGPDIMPLTNDTVIFGPAFTSIGTVVYSMPESPLTAQCKVVDQLKEGEVYVLVQRGEKNCAVFGELFATRTIVTIAFTFFITFTLTVITTITLTISSVVLLLAAVSPMVSPLFRLPKRDDKDSAAIGESGATTRSASRKSCLFLNT